MRIDTDLILARMMRYLPLGWVSALGGHFGERYARNGLNTNPTPQWVNRMHANLARLSGIQNEQVREKRIIEFYRHVGEVFAEVQTLQRIVRAGHLEISGEEHLKNLKGPLLLTSCHLSNWELMGHFVQRIPGRWCSLYLPLENGTRARLAFEARKRWATEAGVKGALIPADTHAMRRIAQEVAKGTNFLFFIDEDKHDYIWNPTLGRNTPRIGNRWFAARLAARHNMEIIAACIEPIGPTRYRAIISPKLRPPSYPDADTRAHWIADRLDEQLNEWILRWPERWYWLPCLDLEKPAPKSY
jgi:KDO2-lipid IV(A) lauroyltransferase